MGSRRWLLFLAGLQLILLFALFQRREPTIDVPPEMVLVPGGTFVMGSEAFPPETPTRRVALPSFLIDRTPVTVREFLVFAELKGWSLSYAQGSLDQPVTGVTWEEAAAFANWQGKRLPTEAEWEKAARGTDGRTYPWGSEYDAKCLSVTMDGPPVVGSAPLGASPYGLMDMEGSVFQWTSDEVSVDLYEHMNFIYPTMNGQKRYVVKGSTWLTQRRWQRASAWFPLPSRMRSPFVGFRCARDVSGAAPVERTEWQGDRMGDVGRLRRLGQALLRKSDGVVLLPPADGWESRRQLLEGGNPLQSEQARSYSAMLGLREGDRIADIGCGTGAFTYVFSRLVGASGAVYAVDVSSECVDFISETASAWRVSNVRPVLSKFNDVCLPPDSVDHVFLYPTYRFLFNNLEDTFGRRYQDVVRPFIKSIHRALGKGGRVEVINTEVQIRSSIVKSHFLANGFRIEREQRNVPIGPEMGYFLSFVKK